MGGDSGVTDGISLRVLRRVGARTAASPGRRSGTDVCWEIPVRGQEVDVEKTARKAGEVIVEKKAGTRTERVGGTIRREEVRVEDRTVDVNRVDDDARS